uniref:Cellular repressor of E1A-stimulated genes 1 n=1 Tax=Sphaeramia orbicularis TaxID=375764 RepID=A0A673BLW1_9TELE
MSARVPAPCVLLLALLWSSCLGVRIPVPVPVRIPPHEQVARVARFVAHQCDWASMATISTHSPVKGQPFSNLFSVSDGPPGNGTGTGVPYMYLTRMEISVQDLEVGLLCSGVRTRPPASVRTRPPAEFIS